MKKQNTEVCGYVIFTIVVIAEQFFVFLLFRNVCFSIFLKNKIEKQDKTKNLKFKFFVCFNLKIINIRAEK